MEPIIGQVIQFAGKVAPRGWAICDGRILAIETYSILYSIIGNKFGGDGLTTFALPNFSNYPFLLDKGHNFDSNELQKKTSNQLISIIAMVGTYPS